MLADTAWLLWIARQSLHGVAIYRDLRQTNPPLSYWLHIPPVLLAERSAAPLPLAFAIFVSAWCGAALFLLRSVWAKWSARPVPPHVAVAAAAVVLFAMPGPFYGQREHFMLAAVLPWLALVAVEASGEEVDTKLYLIAALGVAFAIALKPFFAGWWLSLPLLRRGGWKRMEFWVVPLVGLVYLGLVWRTAYPAYLHEWGPLYWAFAHRPWWFVAVGSLPAAIPAVALVITSAASRDGPLSQTLWVGTLAAWLGAVSQGKGLPYHYWPALALSFLLLLNASAATRVLLVFVVSVWFVGLGTMAIDGGADQRRNLAALDHAAGRGSVLVLGVFADDAWLLNSEKGRPWLSPEYCLWWLVTSKGNDTLPGFPRWRVQNARLREALLPLKPPDVVLLGVRGVDVFTYLTRAPAWARLLKRYRRGEIVAGYQVWRRRE